MDEVRRQALLELAKHDELERIAEAIRDNPGPDPSPASPAWWAGWIEGRDDAARIVLEFQGSVTEE